MLIDTNILSTLHSLRNDEHVGFGQELVENIKADAESLPEAAAAWNDYEEAVSHESTMYKQSPESPETKEIAEADKYRDTYWGEILHRLRFSEKSLDENIRKAAARLLYIVKPYADAPQSNLFGETASLRKVLLLLKAAENNADTALISGLDELILEAETLNETVHTLYDKRLKDKEKIKELGTLADYRKVVDKLLIKFLECVNAIELVNSLGAKNPAVKAAAERIRLQLAALLTQLLKILDRRSPKPGSGKQKPDITNPEVPGTDTPDPEDPGEGGEPGEGEGGTENPDIENPPPPPFLPDFE